MKTRWLLIISGCTILLGGFYISPIRVSRSVTVPGKILCAREWLVRWDANGAIVTTLVDRAGGSVRNTTITEFSRGDFVQMEMNPRTVSGCAVACGDTVVRIHSNEIERQIATLRGDLANAEASLVAISTGEKEPVVQGARQQLEQARREEESLKAILARQKLLFERGLIAQQEYELAERRAAVSGIGVSIASEHLRAVSTGAKREEGELIRARIRALRDELDVLERRRRECALSAPLPGIVMCAGFKDTLLLIADTSEYVVLMPVPLREQQNISPHQRVSLTGRDAGNLPPAIVTNVISPVQILGGQEVFIVTGQCERTGRALVHGTLAQCAIEGAECSLLDYTKGLLSRAVR
jgi:hypothetical protein